VALNNATIVILDMDLSSSSTNAHTEEKRSVRERMVLATAATLARTGIRAQLCTQWMAGTQILAVGDAVALLGEQPQDIAGDINAEQWHRTALVPLVVRCGGGEAGWKELHNAVGSWPGLSRCKGVGIMKGCLLMVNPSIWCVPLSSIHLIFDNDYMTGTMWNKACSAHVIVYECFPHRVCFRALQQIFHKLVKRYHITCVFCPFEPASF